MAVRDDINVAPVVDPSTINTPVDVADPINAKILAISEDKLQGFHREPIREIAQRAGLDRNLVANRISAMMKAGVIRRTRQTLLATNLAKGALVAWTVPEEKLQSAFDYLFQVDPFSGHVVIRSTDRETPGSKYRLWTTLKVPQGYSPAAHCRALLERTGCTSFKLLPAKKLFALGVGHVRRKTIEPGEKTEEPGKAIDVEVVDVHEQEWPILMALKREFGPHEIGREPLWGARAEEAGVSLEKFYEIAESLTERGVIGRFSTFLEHYKKLSTGERVTKFNALFHWAVPPGREMEAGREVGRFYCMTHAYWREAGEEFGNVNIMGVSHGTQKDRVLAHKAAIDEHLAAVGIPVSYTNVFWGGRSEIKPSEISPVVFREFWQGLGVDPETLRA